MAFTCGFFNSQNGDRKYNAEQMASIFDGLIKDGVYDTVGDIFAVTPGTGMQVLVGSGRAWFDHTWNNNDAQYPLAITAADVSLPRYDAVVLETNHSDTVRTNRLRVLTGTPASNPVKPTMTSTANVKQHPLAYIKVTAGATAITQSMIQVVVGTSECPFVTGIIDTAQIDALFQQWNGEFNEWFENLKAQLSDNVVANLQGQIDQKVAKADVATTADIEAGTSTTKWVTPKGLREAGVDGVEIGRIIESYATPDDDYLPLNGQIYDEETYPELINHIPGGFYKETVSNPLYDPNDESGYVYLDPLIKNSKGVAWRTHMNTSYFDPAYTIDNGKTWTKIPNTMYSEEANFPNSYTQYIPGLNMFIMVYHYTNNRIEETRFFLVNANNPGSSPELHFAVGTSRPYSIAATTQIIDDPSRNAFYLIGAVPDGRVQLRVLKIPYDSVKNMSAWTTITLPLSSSENWGGPHLAKIIGDDMIIVYFNATDSALNYYYVNVVSLNLNSLSFSTLYTTERIHHSLQTNFDYNNATQIFEDQQYAYCFFHFINDTAVRCLIYNKQTKECQYRAFGGSNTQIQFLVDGAFFAGVLYNDRTFYLLNRCGINGKDSEADVFFNKELLFGNTTLFSITDSSDINSANGLYTSYRLPHDYDPIANNKSFFTSRKLPAKYVKTVEIVTGLNILGTKPGFFVKGK